MAGGLPGDASRVVVSGFQPFREGVAPRAMTSELVIIPYEKPFYAPAGSLFETSDTARALGCTL